ncbi:MAG TPA: tetratricopeptide repeat protein [Actinomycetota bacterium]|jgi:tetratricopeptide (TPR) repeat protein|nr:tetratricopeptide repeat protein [Actinomycetota bacterium]
MPKALSPRPSERRRRQPAQTVRSLPRDVVNELNRVARSGKEQQAAARLERAVQLLERGDSRGAVSEAQKAKQLAPRSTSVREVLGMALYQQGRWREALSELQTYRRISGRADQNHLIADAERGLGRPERAVPLAEEALAGRGVPIEAKGEAVIVAASALADMGRFDQALGLLRRVRTRDDVARPEVIRVWYVIADILEKAGRPKEAAEQFRKILRHDPGAYDVAERIAQLG